VGQATGVEEKLRRRKESPDAALESKAAARELRVWFSSDVADDMPWRFTPTQAGVLRVLLLGPST
jgi:cytochrome c oxidase assembly protein Cox11